MIFQVGIILLLLSRERERGKKMTHVRELKMSSAEEEEEESNQEETFPEKKDILKPI